MYDESVMHRWAESVYWQFFNGMEYCAPRLPCNTTKIELWRVDLDEKRAAIKIRRAVAAQG
ncbi:hypothetical protein [Azohydromonas australica]|uniref:hypothetical protein n=1 Tax=Azohydromonas australica TaxID=364039 RepID=UPI00041204F2|nr:hypothetical protein [Azohydromonas australica]